MKTLIDNFTDVYGRLIEEKDFCEVGPCKYPALGITSNEEMKQRIAEQLQAQHLPKVYHKVFLKVLLDNYDDIDSKCMSNKRPSWYRLYLSMLTNAALQPDPRSKVDTNIRCLQAVVSDLYKSFVVSRAKLGNLPRLQQELPPLVAFTGLTAAEPMGLPPNPWQIDFPAPPFMMDIDQMKGDLNQDIEIGIMNLSAGFREHPITWSILVHEVGGHGVLHADRTLLTQISDGIVNLFSETDPVLGLIWRQWYEEAAADVCGILNMGPSFAYGAFLFYTALSPMIEVPPRRPSPGKPPKLNNSGLTLYGSKVIDYHYAQVLMPHLLMGAIEHLYDLAPKSRFQHIDTLMQLDELCTTGQRTLDFPPGALVPASAEKNIPLQAKYDLKGMRASAHAVGAFIASAKFSALNKNSLQALETWDDADEERSQLISDRLQRGQALDDLLIDDKADEFDDGCLLAGAIFALLAKPGSYADINRSLGKALELSYRTDGILRPR